MRPTLALAPCAAVLFAAAPALAWEDTGHRLVTTVAIEALPQETPAFVKAPDAVRRLGELAREPDRSRNAGQPHDVDLDPGHFVDRDDEGKVLGGPSLVALPATRQGYEQALQAVHVDSWKAGWLPYSILEGYQQLTKDFAYWRADEFAARVAGDPVERDWYAQDMRLREAIIIRDLGYWSHFVGDGSQPMHVSVHYNGWGDFPNPNNYTREKIHHAFEGEFVRANIKAEMIRAALPPYRACGCAPATATARYLEGAAAKVEPLFQLWAQGGFRGADPRGIAFTVERIAAAAGQLRDFVVDAWRASETATVGYPATSVKAIVQSGKAPPFDLLFGDG